MDTLAIAAAKAATGVDWPTSIPRC